MKRIRLLSLPEPRLERGDPQWEANRVDYRVLIEQVIRMPLNRQAGATIDEMRKGIRVLDALDRASIENAHGPGMGDVLELEDADWEHLKLKTESMPWAMVDRRILQFVDDVTGATDTVKEREVVDGRVRLLGQSTPL